MDEEINELWKEINWRIVQHNHQDIFGHDTCPLCVIENALWGYKK